jgi:hypothetical protein
MIISEKQIMDLISQVRNYIETLKYLRANEMLDDGGEYSLELAIYLLNQINKQQSEELKEIK